VDRLIQTVHVVGVFEQPFGGKAGAAADIENAIAGLDVEPRDASSRIVSFQMKGLIVS